MNEKRSLYIATLGLSLALRNEVKEQFTKVIPQHISVRWVTASDVSLDILVIHDAFYHSPELQQLLNRKHLNVLRLSAMEGQHSSIIENILFLPVINLEPLKTWIDHCLNLETTVFVQERLAEEQHNSTLDQYVEISESIIDTIERLLQHPRGKVRIFDQTGNIGCAEPDLQLFQYYPKQHNEHTCLDFTFAPLTLSEGVRFSKLPYHDLNQWLWNLLWSSANVTAPHIKHENYKLTQWPQPLSHNIDRRNILRMAACFAQGANVEDVSQHFQIPLMQVYRFIFVNSLLKIITPISAKSVQFLPQIQESSSSEKGVIKLFFSKLRRKFKL